MKILVDKVKIRVYKISTDSSTNLLKKTTRILPVLSARINEKTFPSVCLFHTIRGAM